MPSVLATACLLVYLLAAFLSVAVAATCVSACARQCLLIIHLKFCISQCSILRTIAQTRVCGSFVCTLARSACSHMHRQLARLAVTPMQRVTCQLLRAAVFLQAALNFCKASTLQAVIPPL
jgi:hypothetical protein